MRYGHLEYFHGDTDETVQDFFKHWNLKFHELKKIYVLVGIWNFVICMDLFLPKTKRKKFM